MKKEKHIGLYVLLILFGVLLISIASFLITVNLNRKVKREYSGTITRPNQSFILKLDISKTWINHEGDPNQNYGQQFDYVIIDNLKSNLNNWTLTVNINLDNYNLVEVDSFWNVNYDYENSKYTITPHEDIDLVSVKKTQNNSFGFVLLNKNEVTKDDFSNISYSITGTLYRKYISYPMFWVLLISTIAYIAYAISYFVIRIRERHFEAFKKHTYSVISQSMNTFGSLIDTKDPYTKDHSARVSYYSVKIANKMGLDSEFVRNISYIASMHDCGKLVIPDEILTKPAKLTDEEFVIMKSHTTNGGKALENFTSIEGIKDGAMYHHERYDGTGYPTGIKGEEIPLCARIICVADALDAMSSDRCYRKRLSEEKILSELEENAGSQFDPTIAKLAIEMIKTKEINVSEEE